MAQVADILKKDSSQLLDLAIKKGLEAKTYHTREELAEALSPVVTPEEIEALDDVEQEPETQEPETSEPETQAPEEEVAETTAPETAAPEETEPEEEVADEFPRTVYLRLSKGYPLQQPHSRAGVTLIPGPLPTVVEDVDEERFALLESDRYIEVVSVEEYESWIEHRAAVNGSSEVAPDPLAQVPVTSHDDVSNTGAKPTNGRNYDTGVNGGADPTSSNPDGAIQEPRKTRADAAKAKGKSYEEVKQEASALGIDPVNNVKKGVLEKAIETAQSKGIEAANEQVAKAIKK